MLRDSRKYCSRVDGMRGRLIEASASMTVDRDQLASGRRGPVSGPRHLDAIDRAIIEALQENGRESFRRIAAKAGVAEATVRARYARLCADDILQVTGVTNPLGLGFEAEALVGVNTAGRFDVIVELVCTDRSHLLELTNRIRGLESVVSTETFPYLQLCKQVYSWGARLDSAVGGRRR